MNRMYTYPVDYGDRSLIVAQTSHIPILKPQPPLPGGTVGVYRHKTRKQRAGWQAQTHGALLLSYEVERDTHVLHGYADYLWRTSNAGRCPAPKAKRCCGEPSFRWSCITGMLGTSGMKDRTLVSVKTRITESCR